MINATEDLADFVRRTRQEKRLSTRDVANRAGGGISYGYVNQIENRAALGSGVSPSRLIALARGLGVTEDELFAIVRGKPLREVEAMEAQILVMLSQLPTERQEDVLLLVRAFHRAHSIKAESFERQKSKKKRVA